MVSWFVEVRLRGKTTSVSGASKSVSVPEQLECTGLGISAPIAFVGARSYLGKVTEGMCSTISAEAAISLYKELKEDGAWTMRHSLRTAMRLRDRDHASRYRTFSMVYLAARGAHNVFVLKTKTWSASLSYSNDSKLWSCSSQSSFPSRSLRMIESSSLRHSLVAPHVMHLLHESSRMLP